MPIAEGASAVVVYKPYATGVITENSQPDKSSDPGASGGQTLRITGTTLGLQKDTYQSAEIRSDRQISDFRHGTRRVNGNISGEFGPLTFADLLEAAMRGEWSDTAVIGDQTDFTSVAADNATSKFTFTSGDPVDVGLFVGQIIQFTNLSDADNNGKNFMITGFGGSNNREMSVYPAPDTHTADNSFEITTVGATLVNPETGHIQRKFAFEVYGSDVDTTRLLKECRITGFNAQLPSTGIATIDFPVMGRDMEVLKVGSAPFFSAPAAPTTTGLFAAVNGVIRVNGVNQGVVTGVTMQMDLGASSEAVVGQNFVPAVILGRANVTGNLDAFFSSADLLENFVDEDEIEILIYLTTTNAADSPAVVLYMPRVKFGGADVQVQGEGAQKLGMPFQALKYEGAAPGVPHTTIQIVDTEITVVSPS